MLMSLSDVGATVVGGSSPPPEDPALFLLLPHAAITTLASTDTPTRVRKRRRSTPPASGDRCTGSPVVMVTWRSGSWTVRRHDRGARPSGSGLRWAWPRPR